MMKKNWNTHYVLKVTSAKKTTSQNALSEKQVKIFFCFAEKLCSTLNMAAAPLILGGPKNFRPKQVEGGGGGGDLSKKLTLGGELNLRGDL